MSHDDIKNAEPLSAAFDSIKESVILKADSSNANKKPPFYALLSIAVML